MKTLFFEGAGCVPRGEVENCRIRTAFTNDKNEAIYLEIVGSEISRKHSELQVVGFVDSCHYILGNDDENKHAIYHRNNKTFEYTKKEILNFVNSLGCSFDEVVILPELAGYRVFKDHYQKGENYYNFGDEFLYNRELTTRAEEIKKHFNELEKNEGKQYPNFSLWVDQENSKMLHLLRHFNGYNKHWSIINNENWKDNITETTLGKYAC